MNRFGLILAALSAPALAHDPITTKITFSNEIIRIFQKRCLGCHREGGKAPMALLTYEQARPWAKAIKEEVLERRMPPWGAVKGFGDFEADGALTQEEISVITDWVEGGAPEGESRYLPGEAAGRRPDGDGKVRKPAGARLSLNTSLRLRAPARITAIAPQTKRDIDSARVVAEQPDGAIEPLIWLRKYKGGWRTVFFYREPVALPAGTEIRVEPPAAGPFVLYEQR